LLNKATMALTYLTLTYCFKLYEQPSTCWKAGYTRQHSILYQDIINMRPVALLFIKGSSNGIYSVALKPAREVSSVDFEFKASCAGPRAVWHFIIGSKKIETDINHPIVANMEVLMNQQNLLKRHTFHTVSKSLFLWILPDALCFLDSRKVHFHF